MRCSAVLLAGGKSTRMGRDKALLEIDGEPLWRRQLETLCALAPEQLMISGPPRGEYEALPDAVENAGPLGGVSAALQRSSSPLLVVLAVDLPQMTSDYLRSLLTLCREGRGVVPRGPEFFEPLAAVYPTVCASLTGAALRRGKYSMQDFVRSALAKKLIVAHDISTAEMPRFANLNTPADV